MFATILHWFTRPPRIVDPIIAEFEAVECGGCAPPVIVDRDFERAAVEAGYAPLKEYIRGR